VVEGGQGTYTIADVITTLSSLFTPSDVNCPTRYFYAYSNIAATTVWSDSTIVLSAADAIKPRTFMGTLTKQTLSVDTTSAIYKTLYIKGKNNGNYFDATATLTIVVCGNENYSLVASSDFIVQKDKYPAQADMITEIPYATHLAWFT
jgi:hypothetical protein